MCELAIWAILRALECTIRNNRKKMSLLHIVDKNHQRFAIEQVVYMTIGNQAFFLFLYFTGAHFWGELQHVGDVSQQNIKCGPIRTPEIGGVSLLDVLYV